MLSKVSSMNINSFMHTSQGKASVKPDHNQHSNKTRCMHIQMIQATNQGLESFFIFSISFLASDQQFPEFHLWQHLRIFWNQLRDKLMVTSLWKKSNSRIPEMVENWSSKRFSFQKAFLLFPKWFTANGASRFELQILLNISWAKNYFQKFKYQLNANLRVQKYIWQRIHGF